MVGDVVKGGFRLPHVVSRFARVGLMESTMSRS